MSRITPLSPEQMTPAQRRVRDTIIAGPRKTATHGPFNAWLQSPELADRAQNLGAFLRFSTSLSKRLSELAILVVARQWTAQFEWYAHRKLALESGLAEAVIDAIEARRRPDFANTDEIAVYEFTVELLDSCEVSDATYQAALDHLGPNGTVELVGLLGYYTLVSMTLNVYQVPLPEGEAPPLTK
ncbi:MAG: carboxymuconolactone decarboxylase family protein [Alphaproteobacteria bacterium]|jgi:4-carboxymuconolactone decarboxylase|nr:carboxymuconolactone decarboxylase family protein [Alphaproteobacteria bacterium]MDP6515308.1 carboxymuconolactone decarboxylase family protein [Alphaproteobacteria bacterium]